MTDEAEKLIERLNQHAKWAKRVGWVPKTLADDLYEAAALIEKMFAVAEHASGKAALMDIIMERAYMEKPRFDHEFSVMPMGDMTRLDFENRVQRYMGGIEKLHREAYILNPFPNERMKRGD